MEYVFPDIEGIDWEVAHRYIPSADALNETLVEIVKTAAKKADELLSYKNDIEADPGSDSFAAFRICAHAMKSALRSIGASAYSEAYELECAGQNGDRETILEKTEHFTDTYLSIANRLKTITGDVDVARTYDESVFCGLIDRIRTAMEAFDINALQEAFGELQDMETPPAFKEELSRLEEAIVYLEPEQVIASCDALRQEAI